MAVSAFSGKKYSAHKARDNLPEFSSHDTTVDVTGNPRSMGKKYLPVKIPTAYFDNPSGSKNPASGRKTMGLSTRKPIRNIHKLLESPRRNARRRLDSLYDCSRPKENVNPPTVKAQALSAKKVAPKTPVVGVKSVNKPDTKTVSTKSSLKSRQSRLLPPGTIAGSYINSQSSLPRRTSIHKPTNNRLTLSHKNPQVKRPSDVPEESPPRLELSHNLSDDVEKQPSENYDAKKLTENLAGVDSNGANDISRDVSLPNEPQDKKDKSTHCCPLETLNCSDSSKSAATGIKILVNSEEIAEEDLICDRKEGDAVLQRPTVIVMQKETVSRLTVEDFDELGKIPVQDGSYSEILSLQPSANSSKVDESLLFRNVEKACSRVEKLNGLNRGDKMTDFISKLISTNNEMLTKHRSNLIKSISQHEQNLTSMKLMLDDVNAQLDKQKTLEASVKLKGSNNMNNDELSLIFCRDTDMSEANNFKAKLTALVSSENCDTSVGEDSAFVQEENRPRGSKQRKTRKSKNLEPRGEEEKTNDSTNDVLKELNPTENKTENIENEPPQRRRSVRLANKNAHLSASMDENTPAAVKKKYKITQAKSKPCTPSMSTPARGAKWGRRSERPLREYMVLKSAIKFLNTPDSRRYRIGSDERVEIRESLDRTDQAILTDKLLRELHELYATP